MILFLTNADVDVRICISRHIYGIAHKKLILVAPVGKNCVTEER